MTEDKTSRTESAGDERSWPPHRETGSSRRRAAKRLEAALVAAPTFGCGRGSVSCLGRTGRADPAMVGPPRTEQNASHAGHDASCRDTRRAAHRSVSQRPRRRYPINTVTVRTGWMAN